MHIRHLDLDRSHSLDTQPLAPLLRNAPVSCTAQLLGKHLGAAYLWRHNKLIVFSRTVSVLAATGVDRPAASITNLHNSDHPESPLAAPHPQQQI